jgi:hypothetical protein
VRYCSTCLSAEFPRCRVVTASPRSRPALPVGAEPEGVKAAPSAAATVTIAVAGTLASADQAPPPTADVPRRAWRVKKAARKKSTL